MFLKEKSANEKKKKILRIILIIIVILLVLALGFLIYVKTAFISKDEVKEIVLEKMNVGEDEVYFESIDLESDKNLYEVEIYYNNNDYEFKIAAKEGKVIYTDYYAPININNNADSNNSDNESANNKAGTTLNNVSLDDALNIALEDANANESDITIVKKQEDYDDGKLVYDIEFYYSGYEYDYEVRANDGLIIDFSKKRLNGAN